MSTVIKVENLSKQYRLGLINSSSVKDDLTRIWHNIRGKENPMLNIGDSNDRSTKAESKYVWSLKDINFEVEQGEVLGIIGKNGAGKSTLLKILSRITTPTTGTFKSKGRIASLLEVGTGFHPELTGRENIYLNGAILGMRKAEITRKMDEIIDFSGVERYIDTPVKRYSSGMYVRLAFAVAAHLESEILIIDEVLAVGDAEFQKKCLGKMGDISKSDGRTILFVSHNMMAIKNLCQKALFLENGMVKQIGETKAVLKNYLEEDYNDSMNESKTFAIDSSFDFQLLDLSIKNKVGENAFYHECDDEVIIDFSCQVNAITPGLFGYLTFGNSEGEIILESDSLDWSDNQLDNLPIGKHRFSINIPSRTIGVGRYFIYMNFSSRQSLKDFDVFSPKNVGSFEMVDNNSNRGNKRNGFLSTKLIWNLNDEIIY